MAPSSWFCPRNSVHSEWVKVRSPESSEAAGQARTREREADARAVSGGSRLQLEETAPGLRGFERISRTTTSWTARTGRSRRSTSSTRSSRRTWVFTTLGRIGSRDAKIHMSKEEDVPWNPEHPETLKKGADAWNAWRNANPRIEPDLRGADLRGSGQRGPGLSGADLFDADLREAYLRGLDLREANLSRAKP